jgi:hypothetical protein
MSEPIKYIEIERADAWLDYNVSFINISTRQFINLRRKNLSITRIYWVLCRLRIWHDELYNAKTPILIFLN